MTSQEGVWHIKRERGSQFALTLLSILYKLFPRSILNVLLYPVILYFYLSDKVARRSSYDYLKKIYPNYKSFRLFKESYHHLYAFGFMILDTIDACQYKFSSSDIDWFNKEIILNRIGVQKGGVVLSAHFGCLEICRSLQNKREGFKIIPLMYLSNSRKFRDFLNLINPGFNFEYIPIEYINIAIATEIKDRIDKGQYVAMLADRLAPNTPGRKISISFLGEIAQISEGPFALAWALKADVFTVFSAYDPLKKRYQVVWDKIELNLTYNRDKKADEISNLAKAYISNLEQEVRKYPLQWFNFYDFWDNIN